VTTVPITPSKVSVGLCYREIGKYAHRSTDFWCHLLFAGITRTKHQVDPEKSNRALGFPALVMGLCQSYRVPVPPTRSCHRDIGKYALLSTDFWCHLLFARIAPPRHPVDPEKSNRVLGFPALTTSLCQFYGEPVAPNKVIRPPINRTFIEKYCAPSRARHHSSGQQAHRHTSRVHLNSSTKRLENCLRHMADQ